MFRVSDFNREVQECGLLVYENTVPWVLADSAQDCVKQRGTALLELAMDELNAVSFDLCRTGIFTMLYGLFQSVEKIDDSEVENDSDEDPYILCLFGLSECSVRLIDTRDFSEFDTVLAFTISKSENDFYALDMYKTSMIK